MDPLAEIRSKVDSLPDTTVKAGLGAVLRHLEVAEAHYDRARAEDNDDYFNDSVYRSNQAYEGALKEAWRILKGTDPSRKQTHQLETGLAASGVLTDRAKGLLENYRRQWRNPATHDYTLLFGQQDAFLAIWSAVAFASVLLDQIVTKLSEAEAASELSSEEVEAPKPDTPVESYLPSYLQTFAQTPNAFYRRDGSARSEAEVLGWLSAFLKQRVPDLVLESDPLLESGIRPDLLVTRGSQRIVVELKRAGKSAHSLDGAFAQVLRYMRELGIKDGALLIAPASVDQPVLSWMDVYQDDDGELFRIIVIAPEVFRRKLETQ